MWPVWPERRVQALKIQSFVFSQGLETLDLQQLSERLQQSLAEPRLAEALQGALCALDAEPTAAESPSSPEQGSYGG